MEPQSIKAVRAVTGRSVVITWKNGAESQVDLRDHLARFAVFAPLSDGAVPFAGVVVGEYGWSIRWSDDMPGSDDREVAADTLWRLALDQGAAWLKAWRSARGLTQEAAATALGLSNRMVRYYEAGRHLLPKTVRLACLGFDLERAA
ncbi:helix-turn-helix transcriptional regulator [Methylobacterium sp. BTF04]|uniref:helix-turn-helix domain-containing protein n=1 Tax=Methylobacterium sp. BTF04 TaxID=2708300 RepID=UPI0013CF58C2|nr:helix-turn-helix domain-containing protein [Methylobacterium sp. BTF04]NEU12259.1 helix-turn-helix transcriptional regulator [Methylobacterium sp. BTF04]